MRLSSTLFPLLTPLVFGRFLGSEVTALMTTGRNLILFSILILFLIFIFRLFGFHLQKKYGFRLVFFIYITIIFCISFFCYFLRVYLLYQLGLNFAYPLFLIMSAGGALPLPAPSGPSSSSSWTEFDIGVLLEPVSETEEGTSLNSAIPGVAHAEAGPPLIPNSSLETSMRNRVLALENANTPFLLDKEKGLYWSELKTDLDQAPSQVKYNRLIQFESRDLQIRELKHSCYSLFQQVLSEHPALAERAPYNPKEALIDFFDEKRDELDAHLGGNPAEGDRRELAFLDRVGQDLRERGAHSPYIKLILGLE